MKKGILEFIPKQKGELILTPKTQSSPDNHLNPSMELVPKPHVPYKEAFYTA